MLLKRDIDVLAGISEEYLRVPIQVEGISPHNQAHKTGILLHGVIFLPASYRNIRMSIPSSTTSSYCG